MIFISKHTKIEANKHEKNGNVLTSVLLTKIVKYEDIVQNFKKTTESLLSFLKVPWTDNVLKFYEVAQSRNLINTPSYDQVYRPIYSESAYRWKKYEDKIKPILPILKPWINEFNY